MRQLLPAGLFLVLLVVLAGAPLAEKLASNRAGLAAMGCLGSAGGDQPLPPFFQAVRASCRGDESAAGSAFLEAAAQPGARVDVLRAHRPDDLALAQAAIAHHPDAPAAHFWLGDALLAAGETGQARQTYEAGLALDRREADIWVRLARLYETQGDLPAAAEAYSQACGHLDSGKNGCLHAGRLYLALGDYALAELRYRESIVQLPGYEPSFRGLVDTLIARSGTSEGLAYVQALAAQGDAAAQQALNEGD